MRTVSFFTILAVAITTCLNLVYVRSENTNEKNIKEGLLKATLNMLDVFYNSSENKNVLFSPINIYTALALVHLGSSGETEAQLAQFLNFATTAQNNKEKLHEALSEFLKTITETTKGTVYTDEGFKEVKVTDIKVANGIFTQNELNLRQTYLLLAQKLYNTTVDKVDFANAPDKATKHINEYISKQTNGLIPEIYDSLIPKNTKIIIAASLYFGAKWAEKFYESNTQPENFDTESGKITVNMMQMTDYVPYIDHNILGVQMIGLPYQGYDASMYFILPHQDETLKLVVQRLAQTNIIDQLINGTNTTYVNYKIPRTEFKWSKNIVSQLKTLGIKRLFEDAQLDKLVENQALRVDDVTHGTKIKINENGTEAAAVTTIRVVGTALIRHPKPVSFHLNRPFLFLIYHHKTQSVLFLGIVQNPIPNDE